MKKSNKKRKSQKRAREIRKNINGNTLTLKGGYIPVAMPQNEYYDFLQEGRRGTGKHKDKRNKLREKAYSKDKDMLFFIE